MRTSLSRKVEDHSFRRCGGHVSTRPKSAAQYQIELPRLDLDRFLRPAELHGDYASR